MIGLEEILSAFILLVVAIAAFRGGKAHPVTTRNLLSDVHQLRGKVTEIEMTLLNTPTKEDFERLRGEINGCATAKELETINGKVTTVCEKVVGIEKSSDRTAAGVDRLERYFLELGIKGRGA